MEEGMKTDTELMLKLSDAQTRISVGSKQFILNEMSIGRARDFGIEIIGAVDRLSTLTGKDVSEMNVAQLLNEYGDKVFEIITDVLNWVFCYKNSGYKKITSAWVSENISVRIIKEIVKEIARQNGMDWLLPFFADKFTKTLRQLKG
jgi:hypothetical protein